jgi:hypothetical protein
VRPRSNMGGKPRQPTIAAVDNPVEAYPGSSFDLPTSSYTGPGTEMVAITRTTRRGGRQTTQTCRTS